MRVYIEGNPVQIDESALLGVGGEASVYRWKDKALKIYHALDSKLRGEARKVAKAHLARKGLKVLEFPKDLPADVIGPLERVDRDKKGTVAGFVMERVEGAEPLLRLRQRRWCQGVVSKVSVIRIFQRIHEVLSQLHERGVVVGDLNDANLLFRGEDVWWIDADSMQFGPYPCVVGHERFLAPELYGVELSDSSRFSVETDWYAFSVLLFQSLLYIHPYGGVHRQYPTLLRRAEAHQSVMRPEVRYPKAALHFRGLPEPLLEWWWGVFDEGKRGVFPVELLTMTWKECACGFWHARQVCPDCASKERASLGAEASPAKERAVATNVKGRHCLRTERLHTKGTVLCVEFQRGLKYLYEEDGVIRRETGAKVMEQPRQPGMHFAICGDTTWIGYQGRLLGIRHEQVVERRACGNFGNEAMFDANGRQVVALQQEWLYEVGQGIRLGSIVEGQTWFRLGPSMGLGMYQAGRLRSVFVFSPERSGIKRVELGELSGRLVEIHASFSKQSGLLQVGLEQHGKRIHHVWVIDTRGEVVAKRSGHPDSSALLETLEGKVLVGDRLLWSTDQGLCSGWLDREKETIEEGPCFPETEPYVEAGAELLAGPGGTVFVATHQAISQLTLVG